MTGNSRLHMPHHSAQKIMKTGLASSERVNVSLPSSPSDSVKSGAAGPSGGGPGGFVVDVSAAVVVVPENAGF